MKDVLLDPNFWVAVGERAVRTGAQVLAGLLVAQGAGILNAPWQADLSVVGMAVLLSVLMSVAAGTTGPQDGPSFVNEVVAKNQTPKL